MNALIQNVSPAHVRVNRTLSVIPWGYRRQMDTPGVNTLRMQLPPALLALLGWRAGQPIRFRVNAEHLQCTGVNMPCAVRATRPLKKSRPQRLRFEREWAKALIQLRRGPKSRRWSVELGGKGAPINSPKTESIYEGA